MKVLEKLFLPLKEQQYLDKLIINNQVAKLSVNQSYSISKEGSTCRSFASLDIQSELKQMVNAIKSVDKTIKKKVLLKIHISQVVKKNADGGINIQSVVDTDNTLKHLIDTLSGTVLEDDNLVYGLVVTRGFNEAPYSFFRITVFNYNSSEFDQYKSDIKNKYNLLYHSNISLKGLKIPSFNTAYEVVQTGTTFKKVLSEETKEYKKFLSTRVKDEYDGEASTNNIVFVLRIGITNPEIRDLDNMFKATLDSLTKIVYKDDKQIDTIIATKEQVAEFQEFVEISTYSKDFGLSDIKYTELDNRTQK